MSMGHDTSILDRSLPDIDTKDHFTLLADPVWPSPITLNNKSQGLTTLKYLKYDTLAQGKTQEQRQESNPKWQQKIRGTYIRPHSLCLTTIIEEDEEDPRAFLALTKGLRKFIDIPTFSSRKKRPLIRPPRRGYPPPSYHSESWNARELVKLILSWNRQRGEQLFARAKESRHWTYRQSTTLAERQAYIWNAMEMHRLQDLWSDICGKTGTMPVTTGELANFGDS